ncbi:MAG: uroporphyrin-III C-methyltransferase / precorrin-2 dehydrogenase / sirohydrochlorin ferrochelatase [Pseudonocardiales bacterium]|nr:uroporphyrin-III C-methyltransferase / precorrin-2 dehydrogenase / sirohydrochlorin ferrochelatase [Pseudonocardiales bacterium]
MTGTHMTGFPLLLDLSGRPVLVVGGGAVGTRRVRSLLEAGASVRVVAPEVTDQLAASGVPIERRLFRAADLDGAWLAIACTDDGAVNAAVVEAADERRVFCVRADAAQGGSARTPATLRRDGLTVAVTGGDDPLRAVALRDAISVALDVGELPARPARPAAAGGSVALVGGGPGDPELITVRGRRLVAAADVIVVDRLAPRALLRDLPDSVEVIDCGKSAHRHNLTQAEINGVLIGRAQAGKRVVRLKGGDPFVFGRGGEEFLACVAAGVPVTVVPGISSALAAPAAAGIPLTHRGVAADFTVVSGHLDPGRPAGEGIDWPGLAVGAGTLVLLMSMDRLDLIAGELIAHGRAATTPSAVVYRATLDGQQVVRAPLGELAKAVSDAGVGAPAVIVIGDVVDVLQP